MLKDSDLPAWFDLVPEKIRVQALDCDAGVAADLQPQREAFAARLMIGRCEAGSQVVTAATLSTFDIQAGFGPIA
jgi:hypothetical protein